MQVLICTGDRDALQLVNDDVTVLYPVKGVSELARMTPAAVEAKYGVPPRALPGPRGARRGVQRQPAGHPRASARRRPPSGSGSTTGSQGILDAADQVPGKAGESLRDNLDQVRLNRQLNALLTDLELPLGPEDLAARPWDRPALHAILGGAGVPRDPGPPVRDAPGREGRGTGDGRGGPDRPHGPRRRRARRLARRPGRAPAGRRRPRLGVARER